MEFSIEPNKQKEYRMQYLELEERKKKPSRVLYPVKLYFKSEGKIKTCSGKNKQTTTTTKHPEISLSVDISCQKNLNKFFRERERIWSEVQKERKCTR